MAPRSSWKGFLRLSLVTVPVKAFTANDTAAEVHLNQLHANCHNRIRYQKTCPEHGEVPADQIVSGYEYGKGQYVVIDPEELAKMRTTSDKAINIQGFVAPDALDARYHAGKTYYLLPDGAVGQKPYALLRQAMIDKGVNALAKVVMTNREHMVLVRPVEDLLVMTILNHEAKVKALDEFEAELAEQKVSADELALTETLIEATRIADLDYARYKDDYVEKMTALIQAKVDGQEVVRVAEPEEPVILNLMEALKRSVADAQAGAAAAVAPVPEPAPVAKLAPSAVSRARKKQSG